MREVDVRRALNKEIPKFFPDDSDTLVIDELGICQGLARIDVAVINGSIHGFEIKSESDNHERLPSQLEVYNRVLETMTIVSAGKYVRKAKVLYQNGGASYKAISLEEPGNNNPSIQVDFQCTLKSKINEKRYD